MSVTEALLTTGLAVVASVITAFVTARLQAASELRKWTRDIRLSYAQAANADGEEARRIAAQFAIGFVKILDTEERERYFIPANIRITLGRMPGNDIIVNDQMLSSKHCAFASDDRAVYIEDLGSTNRTLVNDAPVAGRVMLADADIIRVGKTRLEYRSLGRKPTE